MVLDKNSNAQEVPVNKTCIWGLGCFSFAFVKIASAQKMREYEVYLLPLLNIFMFLWCDI